MAERVELELIGIRPWGRELVILLKQTGEPRYVTIPIDSAEAAVIQNILARRDITQVSKYTLLLFLLEETGMKTRSIVINEGTVDTLYADIALEYRNELLRCAATAQEAIMLAAYSRCSIAITVDLLQLVGVRQEILEQIGVLKANSPDRKSSLTTEQPSPVPEKELSDTTQEELEQLTPFREVVDKVNWAGFDEDVNENTEDR